MPRLVQIPFTGKYNTRIALTGVANTSGGYVGVGVVGLMVVGATQVYSSKDEQYINCFLTNEGGRKYIVKRPGVSVATSNPSYVTLTGAAGTYASTPSAAANQVTANLTIIWCGAATNWNSGAAQILLSKWNTAGNLRSYNWFINASGTLTFNVSIDGTAATQSTSVSTAPPPAVNGSSVWLKASLNSITGVVTFYYSNDQISTSPTAVNWSQLGASVSGSAIAIFAGTADVEVGMQNAGASSPFNGKIYRSQIYNGSTLAVDLDPNNAAYGATSWISIATSETWTLNGAATLTKGSYENIGTAILVWTGLAPGTNVISAFGNTNSVIFNGTTGLGAITGKATAITETVIGTTPTLAISSSDNTGWYYDVPTAVVTKITDVNFPGNAGKTLAGTFAHMDGWAFIMDTTGALWNSTLNTVTGWAALNFVTANAYPDKGIGCIRYKNQIIAFGSESMQFYYNAGNAVGSPLARIDTATVKIGAINSDSIGQIADAIFWVGSSPQGGCSVFQYDGSPQRISTPEQDYQLLLAGPNNITLTTMRFYGRSFVMVIAGTTTLAYCVEDKSWHQWINTTPLWFKSCGLSTGNQILTYSISNQSTSGKVYTINPASLVFTDDGTTFTATAQTEANDFNQSGRIVYDQLRVIADIEPTTSPLTIAYSDDDFNTFTTWGTVDLSTATPRASRIGSSHKRAWQFSHSANTAMRIHRVDALIDVADGYR